MIPDTDLTLRISILPSPIFREKTSLNINFEVCRDTLVLGRRLREVIQGLRDLLDVLNRVKMKIVWSSASQSARVETGHRF